jgi:phosphopantothenoylcysteine decarboxylase/phosphopantothenate--cysteine ligase
MLEGKKILVGVTGSIAAYKSALLIRLLIKSGAEVKVVMSPSAADFISPLTLSTLSGNPVLTELSDKHTWSNHVMLGRWADLMILAPLSCNSLAKMAVGLCDNLLLAVYLSATCKVVVAPAMDEDMWKHPATQKNLEVIRSYGNDVIPVEYGSLASGLTGNGRMAEPETIIKYIAGLLNPVQDLSGKHVMITAGPTMEQIDPVRYIGNHSSGKMGYAIAEACVKRGAQVTLISGPVNIPVPAGVDLIKVKSAQEMYDAAQANFSTAQIAIMAAAVADYRVDNPADEKIKKKEEVLQLALVKNPDILQSLGKIKEHQILVGFALETNNEEANALKKLQNKNADIIVLNSLQEKGAGFGTDTNKIIIFDRHGNKTAYALKSKKEVAVDIINSILNYAKN